MKRLVVTALICCSTPAFAQDSVVSYFKDGNQLLQNCDRSSDFDQGICAGYVIGAVDGLSAKVGKIPDGVTIGQMKDVIIKYLVDHPESRNSPAASLVYLAVLEAWPKPSGDE